MSHQSVGRGGDQEGGLAGMVWRQNKDRCSVIPGVPEQRTVPDHQEAQLMFIQCRMAFFPPSPPGVLLLFPFSCSFSYLSDRLHMSSQGKEKLR